MPYKTEIIKKEDYLILKITSGEWELGKLKQFVLDLKEELKTHNMNKALVDLRIFNYNPSDLQRHQLGLFIAEHLKHPIKISAVAKKRFINKFAEDTAVNRGVQLLATHDFDEAVKWLKGN